MKCKGSCTSPNIMKLKKTFRNDRYEWSEIAEISREKDLQEDVSWILGTYQKGSNEFLGHWECLSQSDYCPPKFYEDPPTEVLVEIVCPRIA